MIAPHYLVKCQCLKSNNWKQQDFWNDTFWVRRPAARRAYWTFAAGCDSYFRQ